MVSQKYKKLQGEDRNILLAAAHVEDAKTGRSVHDLLLPGISWEGKVAVLVCS